MRPDRGTTYPCGTPSNQSWGSQLAAFRAGRARARHSASHHAADRRAAEAGLIGWPTGVTSAPPPARPPAPHVQFQQHAPFQKIAAAPAHEVAHVGVRWDRRVQKVDRPGALERAFVAPVQVRERLFRPTAQGREQGAELGVGGSGGGHLTRVLGGGRRDAE
jgi:hypothetical protein